MLAYKATRSEQRSTVASETFKMENAVVTNETIYERLTPIFRDVFDDDTVTPHPDMTAAEVPAWDSLSNIRLVVAVEEEFGFQFSTGEVTSLKNVAEFVSVIKNYISR